MAIFDPLTANYPCLDLYRSLESSISVSNITSANYGISHIILQHYNYTGRLQNRTIWNTKTHIGVSKAVFLFLSAFIILENLLVFMAVVSRILYRRRWVYVCIANITLSDLITGAAFMVNICMSGSQTFRLTPALWLFREGMLFVALAASIFSLLLIAVERYTTMMKLLPQQSARMTYCRIYNSVVLCWVLALVIGFLPLLGWNCLCSLDRCSTFLPLYSKSYILFSLIIFFLILLTIAALYGAIYCHVLKSTKIGNRRHSMALLKTVVAIVGVFMLCWGPLFLLLLVDFFCVSHQCVMVFNADFFISLAVLHSGLNPIIYALGSTEMRKAMAQLLCYICPKTSPCHLDMLSSKESSSTSGSRRDSLRNSFSKNRILSVSSPSLTVNKQSRAHKKCRLSSTTTCLSISSG